MNMSTNASLNADSSSTRNFLPQGGTEGRTEPSTTVTVHDDSQRIALLDPADHAPQRTWIKAFCDNAYAAFIGVIQFGARAMNVMGLVNKNVLDARGDRIKHLLQGNDEVAGLLRLKIGALKAGKMELANCYGKAAEVSAEKTKNGIEQLEALKQGNVWLHNKLGTTNKLCDQQIRSLQQQADAYQKAAEAIELDDDISAEIHQKQAEVYQKQADAYHNTKKAFELGDDASSQIYQKQADAYQKAAEAIDSENNKLTETYAKIAEIYEKMVLTIAKKNRYIDSEKANKGEDELLAKFLSDSISICDQKIELFRVEAKVLACNDGEFISAYENAKRYFEMQLLFLNEKENALQKNDQGKAGICEQLAFNARGASEAYLKQLNALEGKDNNRSINFLVEAISKADAIQKKISSIELQAQHKEKVRLELKEIVRYQELVNIYGKHENLGDDEIHAFQKAAEAAVQKDLSLQKIELLDASQKEALEQREALLAEVEKLTTRANKIKDKADLQRQTRTGADSSNSKLRVITAEESSVRGLASNQTRLAVACSDRIDSYETQIQELEKSVQELDQKIEDYSKLATAHGKLGDILAKRVKLQEIIGGTLDQAIFDAYRIAAEARVKEIELRKEDVRNKYETLEEVPSQGGRFVADYSYGNEDQMADRYEKQAEVVEETIEALLKFLKERDQLEKEIASDSLSKGVKKQKIQIVEDTKDEIEFYAEMLDLLSKQAEAFKSNNQQLAENLGKKIKLLEKDFNNLVHSFNERITRANPNDALDAVTRKIFDDDAKFADYQNSLTNLANQAAQPQKRVATAKVPFHPVSGPDSDDESFVSEGSQGARLISGSDSDDEEEVEEGKVSQDPSIRGDQIKTDSSQGKNSPNTVAGLNSPRSFS